MPGRNSSNGAGHGGRPHPSRRAAGTGRSVLTSTRSTPARTMLASSSGKVAPGYGSTALDDRPPAAPNRRQRRKERRRHRSTGERVLRWTVLGVAVILLVALVGYGYVRYRWGQVQTAACSTCAAVADGQPFNVLIVGSDTRAGNTGSAAQSFGSASEVAGQRSDTIKILHVDPSAGTADLLSIPRDTYVQMSDIPASSGLSGDQKINTAFNDGPEPLIATIQNTFGIPIQHFVIVDFEGLTNAVNTLGGIDLDFPFPVRDNDDGNNNAGLNIPTAGCQLVSGRQTLALARSRYYEYDDDGDWTYDPTGDLGRIERQNIIIDAMMDKARSTINPLTLNALLGSVVHDIVVDNNMTFGDMLSLGLKYDAFSPSKLATYTLPTLGADSEAAGDVEVVDQPQAQQVITAFLHGTPAEGVSTPPVDQYGDPIYPPTTSANEGSGSSGSSGSGSSGSSGSTGSSGSGSSGSSAASPSSSIPFYDPRPCKT